MAHLGLADAVDSSEPLLDPVRIPGQVVVDEKVRPLEVDAFSGRVGRDEDQAVLVLGEALLDDPAFFAGDTTVDRDDGFWLAQIGAQLVDEVVEGVAVLGEDDQLPPCAARLDHLGRFREQTEEFRPLLVDLGLADLVGKSFEALQRRDLVLQLCERASARCLVDELLLQFLDLSTFEIFDVVVEVLIGIIELDS